MGLCHFEPKVQSQTQIMNLNSALSCFELNSKVKLFRHAWNQYRWIEWIFLIIFHIYVFSIWVIDYFLWFFEVLGIFWNFLIKNKSRKCNTASALRHCDVSRSTGAGPGQTWPVGSTSQCHSAGLGHWRVGLVNGHVSMVKADTSAHWF